MRAACVRPILTAAAIGPRAAEAALPMSPDNRDSSRALVQHLQELIEALERRVPHIEREGELDIAREAASLKALAVARLAELERER